MNAGCLRPHAWRTLIVAAGLSTIGGLAGCHNGWDSHQIRDHLASDFHQGMSRPDVEAELRTYPTSSVYHPHAKFDESRWLSPSEWAARFATPYAPWTLRDDQEIEAPTGPVVLTSHLRIRTTAPMSLGGLLGGGAPYVPSPYTVWFVFDENLLTRWGHSAGTAHYLYPDETAEGPAAPPQR